MAKLANKAKKPALTILDTPIYSKTEKEKYKNIFSLKSAEK